MAPLQVLERWFAAFADQDMDAARLLWCDSATLHSRRGDFTGDLDAFLAWYARRRESEGAGFTWQVLDLLGGERYAAAVIRLRSDDRPTGWDQHAVYEVDAGKIHQVWLHE